MDITNFDWTIDEERLIQDFKEFKFAGVLEKLSPFINSLQEKDDCFMLVLDLPVKVNQNDIKLRWQIKSITLYFKDNLDRGSGKRKIKPQYTIFREIWIPENGIERLITFKVCDSTLFLKIPKMKGFKLATLLKFSWHWIKWRLGV